MHHLVRLAALVLLAAAVPAADVQLAVTAGSNAGGALTSTWRVLSMPAGATAPVLTPGTAGRATASFAGTALPGTYVIEVALADGTSPVAVNQTAIQVTRSQTITFANPQTDYEVDPGAVMDVDPQAATTAPGLGVVYRIVGTSPVASIVGNRIRPLTTGSVEIEADVEAHAPVRYRSAPVRRTYTFRAPALARQTIQVAATTLAVVKGTRPVSLSLGATATSGLPIAYRSSDTAVATVAADGTVTVLRPGTTTFTLEQPGDRRTAAAAPVTVLLTVTAAAITVTRTLTATPATLDLP